MRRFYLLLVLSMLQGCSAIVENFEKVNADSEHETIGSEQSENENTEHEKDSGIVDSATESTDDSEWTCVDELSTPDSGVISCSDKNALGSVCNFACDNGYEIEGSVSRTCTESGWSGTAPVCLGIDCGAPETFNGAEAVYTGTRYPASVTYLCADGYEGDGGGMNCGVDQQWSGDAPDCSPVDSGTPFKWPHKRVITIESAYSSDLANHPVLVILNENGNTFDYSEANSDGSDLRFSTEGTGDFDVDYTIEKWSPGSVSLIWIKVPILLGGDSTRIYMFYGNKGAASEAVSLTEMFPDNNEAYAQGDMTQKGNITADSFALYGGTLTICENSVLHIQSQRIVINGTINGEEWGYGAADGPGPGATNTEYGGGGGGAHAGAGGMGGKELTGDDSAPGGAAYDDHISKVEIKMGSGGGHGYSNENTGGAGGGAVWLDAQLIIVNGEINVAGQAGMSETPSDIEGGGGGGGGVLLVGNYLDLSGTITANGGNGGSNSAIGIGGGGGGGGIVKLFYDASINDSSSKNVKGGLGGIGVAASVVATNGDDGMTTTLERKYMIRHSVTLADAYLDDDVDTDTETESRDSDTSSDDTSVDTDMVIDEEIYPDVSGCFMGDYVIREASDIEAIDEYDCIVGDLSIGGVRSSAAGEELSDLNGLSNLKRVWGMLTIGYTTALHSLAGLENLEIAHDGLKIQSNPALEAIHLPSLISCSRLRVIDNVNLTDLGNFEKLGDVDELVFADNDRLEVFSGLGGIKHVNGNVILNANKNTDLCGFESIEHISGDLSLLYSNDLTSFKGLSGLQRIDGDLEIRGNDSVIFIDSFEHLEKLGGNLIIGGSDPFDESILTGNEGLIGIVGFEKLTDIGGYIRITNNPSLDDCAICDFVERIDGVAFTTGFGSNKNDSCTSEGCGVSQQNCLIGALSVSSAEDMSLLTRYDCISGDVYISGDVQDLFLFENITEIGGNLVIQENPNLESLDGFSSLNQVHGRIAIAMNESLRDLEGLSGVTGVVGGLAVLGNRYLLDLNGLQNITEISGNLEVDANKNLLSLKGLEGITAVHGHVALGSLYEAVGTLGNENLASLDGLKNVEKIGAYLMIRNNASLKTLSGLQKLTEIGDAFDVTSNSMLDDIEVDNLAVIGGSMRVFGNHMMTDIGGLNSLERVGRDILISKNNALEKMTSFKRILQVHGDLRIGGANVDGSDYGNASLKHLDDWAALQSVWGNLDVFNNKQIPQCKVDQWLSSVEVIHESTASPNGNTDPQLCN